MSDDADRIKYALTDARALCDALHLLGRPGRDWLRQAAGAIVRCPWHDEKTPSCSVTLAGGTIRVRCFGCGETGDALSLIAVVYRLDVRADFAELLDTAADLAGVPRPDRSGDRPRVVRAIAPRPVVVEPPDDGIMGAVAAVLADRARVTSSVLGMRYLRSRGLDSGAALGWYALPDGRDRDDLVAAIVATIGSDAWMRSGLATVDGPRAGSWSYAWKGLRLVIPWRAPNGTVETLQGRYVGDCPDGTSKYVFPRERRPRWPWGVDAMESVGADTALAIVEGAIDAVSFDALASLHGLDAKALAVPGVSAWRDEWTKLCARRPCIVAFDKAPEGKPGEAVEAARAALTETLRLVARRGERGPMVRVRTPKRGKDWNDALRATLAAERKAA